MYTAQSSGLREKEQQNLIYFEFKTKSNFLETLEMTNTKNIEISARKFSRANILSTSLDLG